MVSKGASVFMRKWVEQYTLYPVDGGEQIWTPTVGLQVSSPITLFYHSWLC